MLRTREGVITQTEAKSGNTGNIYQLLASHRIAMGHSVEHLLKQNSTHKSMDKSMKNIRQLAVEHVRVQSRAIAHRRWEHIAGTSPNSRLEPY